VTLHDELRELAASYGRDLFLDADQFRAALDDYIQEGSALPGQLNLLHDAVRLGAYARCLNLLEQSSEPSMAVQTAGDALARERGSLEAASSRWAVATLAHATGHLDRSSFDQFRGSHTPGSVTLSEPDPPQTVDMPDPPAPTAPAPVPAPTAAAPRGPRPTGPPPTAGVKAQSAPSSPDDTPPPATPAEVEPVVAHSTVKVPPPPLPPLPRNQERRRRGSRITVAAVGAVILLAGGGYAVHAVLEDPDERDSGTRPGSGSESPSASRSTDPSTDPPLLTPGEPRITAQPAYKKVIFDAVVAGESADLVYELRTRDGWAPTEARFELPTEKGGKSVCATVRAVRVDSDTRSVGPSDRECGTSLPLRIEWLPASDKCKPEYMQPGFTCRQFDLLLRGFRANASVPVELVKTTQRDQTVDECTNMCTDTVTVDAEGRADKQNYAHAYVGQTLTLIVAGQPTQISVRD
jgi:hypothetical protein